MVTLEFKRTFSFSIVLAKIFLLFEKISFENMRNNEDFSRKLGKNAKIGFLLSRILYEITLRSLEKEFFLAFAD